MAENPRKSSNPITNKTIDYEVENYGGTISFAIN